MWGGRSYSNDIDIITCVDCDDHFNSEEDDWNLCGECQGALCSACVDSSTECSVCAKEETPATESVYCCEGCREYCDDCSNEDDCISFHKGCKAEHLANCNAKSRAQRAVAVAAQAVTETEEKLKEEKRRLVEVQENVANLEKRLARAQEDKAKADKSLATEKGKSAAEEESPASQEESGTKRKAPE